MLPSDHNPTNTTKVEITTCEHNSIAIESEKKRSVPYKYTPLNPHGQHMTFLFDAALMICAVSDNYVVYELGWYIIQMAYSMDLFDCDTENAFYI
jgi:hypothetical protein